MIDDETPLEGGNASGTVMRVGDTVRKPWLDITPAVNRYVEHLLSRGIPAQRPLGRDEQGRQVLSFTPGTGAQELPPLDTGDLARAGALLRELHEASVGYVDDAAPWRPLLPTPGADLICHNDFAPWNLIVGERWTIIDWDGAGPSTRLWDLAYAAQAFARLGPGLDPDEGGRRLRAFVVAGYGASDDLLRALPETLGRRTAAMHAMLRDAHASGREPWGTMFTEGHGDHWAAATRYTTAHAHVWRKFLRPAT